MLLSASGSLWWTAPSSRWLSQRLLVTLTPQRNAPTVSPSSAEKTASLHNAAPSAAAGGDAGHTAIPKITAQPAMQPAMQSQPETAPVAEKSTTNKPADADNYPIIPIANGLLAGPWYYPARYLHRRPSPLHPIKPDYPPEARSIAGRVVLVLLLNTKGGVDDYRIEATEPPGVFEDAVIQAFTRETYAPGMITGYPVKSQMLVEVRFEPGETPRTTVLPELPR